MEINQELYRKLILYIGDIESTMPYIFVKDVQIPGYTFQDIYNHVSVMIEGEILDGLFAAHESSPHHGYLIGGLTTESRYLYHQLKKAQH
jgi:hypothetical protein